MLPYESFISTRVFLCLESEGNYDELSICQHTNQRNVATLQNHIPVNYLFPKATAAQVLILIGCVSFWNGLNMHLYLQYKAHPLHGKGSVFQCLPAEDPSRAVKTCSDYNTATIIKFLATQFHNVKIRGNKNMSVTTCSFCSLSRSISRRTSKTFAPTQHQLLSPPANWHTHTDVR